MLHRHQTSNGTNNILIRHGPNFSFTNFCINNKTNKFIKAGHLYDNLRTTKRPLYDNLAVSSLSSTYKHTYYSLTTFGCNNQSYKAFASRNSILFIFKPESNIINLPEST